MVILLFFWTCHNLPEKIKITRSFVPSIVQPSIFVTFVYDNSDHNPETLSGISVHCTNGIIVQRPSNSSSFPSRPAVLEEVRSRKRSFQPLYQTDKKPLPIQKKVVPPPLQAVEVNNNALCEAISKKSDFVWVTSRFQAVQFNQDQMVPSWTGFFQSSSDPCEDISKVVYLPSIAESPTKMSTVQEILLQVKAKAEAIGLDETDLVLDHAIYKPALEVIMDPQNVDLKGFVNLRMGGFHASCIFIAVIGKRFAAAGLQDLCIEAELVGMSTSEKIMKGKQYNKAVRSLKIAYEAFQRLRIESFEEWLISKHGSNAVLVSFLESTEMEDLVKCPTSIKYQVACNKADQVFQKFLEFEEVLDQYGAMANFWNSFVTMVQILLDFIKSTRKGDWIGHLQASERMIKWLVKMNMRHRQ